MSGTLQGSPCEIMPPINEGTWTITASGTGKFGLTAAICEAYSNTQQGQCQGVLGGTYKTYALLYLCGGELEGCTNSATVYFSVNDSCNSTPVNCLLLASLTTSVPEFPLGATVLVALALPLLLLIRHQRAKGQPVGL
jgi:hypothetical protein